MNSDARTYRMQALYDHQNRLPSLAEKIFPVDQGSSGAVMRSQKMHLMTDPRAIQDEIQFLGGLASGEPSLAATISHPLIVYGRAFGAVTFATTMPGGYDDEDIHFASSIATQLALAIDRLQQAQQLRQTRQELGSLASFPELNPSAIIELDAAGQVYYLNPAAKERFPEWRQLGLQSPILADLPEDVALLREGRERSHLREVKVGGPRRVW